MPRWISSATKARSTTSRAGASFSSAAMAALMTVEATKLDSTALTGGQFRHGPLELVREGFRAVLFLGSGVERELNELTALDIARFGGRCLVIAANPPASLRREGIRYLNCPKSPRPCCPRWRSSRCNS